MVTDEGETACRRGDESKTRRKMSDPAQRMGRGQSDMMFEDVL
jgi:hypothetical protein